MRSPHTMKCIALVAAGLFAAALSLLCLVEPASPRGVVDCVLDASVSVRHGDSYGSGVTFVNGTYRYVWTDAHVLADTKTVALVLDADTQKQSVRVSFDDVWVTQDVVAGGRKAGLQASLARVIRYSDRHDIALLKLYRPYWPARGAAFDRAVPSRGEAVWHVGSMHGERGAHSLADGVFASVGRLRRGGAPQEVSDPLVYDQVSLGAAHPGSSGGGIFRKRDGVCVGLVTEYLGPGRTFGALCITPSRRLYEFAASADCLWALDARFREPARDLTPVFQDALEVESVGGE